MQVHGENLRTHKLGPSLSFSLSLSLTRTRTHPPFFNMFRKEKNNRKLERMKKRGKYNKTIGAGSQDAVMELSSLDSLRTSFRDKISSVLETAIGIEKGKSSAALKSKELETIARIRVLPPDSSHIDTVPVKYKSAYHVSKEKHVMYAVAFHPTDERRLVTAGSNGQAHVWTLGPDNARSTRSVQLQGPKTTCITLSPDGKTAVSGGKDGKLHAWDIASGELKYTVEGHDRAVSGVAAHSASGLFGVILSTGVDKTVRIWSMETGEAISEPVKFEESFLCATLSPDGKKLIAGFQSGMIQQWEMVLNPPNPNAPANHEGRENDGAGTATVELRQKPKLQGHTGEVSCVVVTPNSMKAVSGSADCSIKVWDLQNGVELYSLLGHDGPITSVAMFPDGERAVSSSGDGAIIVWNLGAGVREQKIKISQSTMIALGVSCEGSYLVAGSTDCKVRVWRREMPSERGGEQGAGESHQRIGTSSRSNEKHNLPKKKKTKKTKTKK